jgi:mRNA interferase RelE/StbE
MLNEPLDRYSQTVQKQLDNLPAGVRSWLTRCILVLKENPRPRGCVKLRSYESEYRIRVGDYRVRYEIRDQESIVLVIHCGHRRDAE